MAAVNVILPSKEVRRINAVAGTSLLKALQAAGIYIPAICGGKGSCGKCRLRLASGTLPVTDADRACFSSDELNGGWRLACAAFPSGDITAELPETGESNFYAVENFEQKQAALNVSCKSFSPQKIPQSFARQLEPGRRLSYPELLEASKLAEPPPGNDLHAYRDGNARVIRIGGENEAVYAAAVDLGTTTLGFSLVNLRSGDVNCRYSAVNKQREYGGDVITRIQKANDGGLSALSQCAREQIAGGITALCSDAGIALKDIHKIAVAGNTTMLHLLLGLSCQTLGKTPFTPVTLDMVFLNHRELFDEEFSSGLNPGCEVVILPGISTYVGADITAGLFYSEFHKTADAALFLDIGTNGEMALARDGKILCAATAAGPAFEGGDIL
ncbi:MAG: ASKHA domain-containing protein, partial [Treponema sp.]|nr:ASKHA domain-containing protein [Treponema sp.]